MNWKTRYFVQGLGWDSSLYWVWGVERMFYKMFFNLIEEKGVFCTGTLAGQFVTLGLGSAFSKTLRIHKYKKKELSLFN